MTRTVAVVLTFAAFGVTAAGSALLGYRWADGQWQEKEAQRMTAIAKAVGETVARSNALAVEVEKLRARPERVRTVTQEVVKYVHADAHCESLPPSFRSLWNVEPDADPPAGTARVGDGAVRAVAADPR